MIKIQNTRENWLFFFLFQRAEKNFHKVEWAPLRNEVEGEGKWENEYAQNKQ